MLHNVTLTDQVWIECSIYMHFQKLINLMLSLSIIYSILNLVCVYDVGLYLRPVLFYVAFCLLVCDSSSVVTVRPHTALQWSKLMKCRAACDVGLLISH